MPIHVRFVKGKILKCAFGLSNKSILDFVYYTKFIPIYLPNFLVYSIFLIVILARIIITSGTLLVNIITFKIDKKLKHL